MEAAYSATLVRNLGICLAQAVVETLALEMFETKHEKSLHWECVWVSNGWDDLGFWGFFTIPHSSENFPPKAWPDYFSVPAGT